jgi:hypothetical protein
VLILSKGYDGRTGKGREAWLILGYNGDGSGMFTITLRGRGWDGAAPELPKRGQDDGRGYRWGIDRTYFAIVSAGVLADWQALHAPRGIQCDWLADHTSGPFAAAAAVLAAEFSEGEPIDGWAAIAMHGG